MKRSTISIISSILIAIMIVMLCTNYSNASSYYYDFSINSSPQIAIDVTNKNYVKFTMSDGNGINEVTVKLYDSSTKEYKTVKSSYYTLSNNKKTLKISASLFNTTDYVKIRISATDKGYKLTSTKIFLIKKLETANSNGKYFSVKKPASMTNESAIANSKSELIKSGLVYTMTKSTGIKSVKVWDMVADKVMVNKTNLNDVTTYTFNPNLDKYVGRLLSSNINNYYYRIKMKVTSEDGTVRVEEKIIKTKKVKGAFSVNDMEREDTSSSNWSDMTKIN